jgi:hypothetical protein
MIDRNQIATGQLGRFVLTFFLAAFVAHDARAGDEKAGAATGPLRVLKSNPRYFTDGSGRAIYLTGSHTWSSLQDIDHGGDAPSLAAIGGYSGYLDQLVRHHHNFIRMWILEHAWSSALGMRVAPHPWARTGPGQARDGRPRFNLDELDRSYFRRLRERVVAAGDRGIYVSIMLFDDWSTENKDAWEGHPFHRDNNVNRIDGDPDGDGLGLEFHTLRDEAILRYQVTYIRKVIDTVNDLDNILYEIANETGVSRDWQYHFIKLIKSHQAGKRKQHPIGMTVGWPVLEVGNAALFAGGADWISPNADGGYKDDPPNNGGRKVILSDTDHLWGVGGDSAWVWKSFLRGLNPIYMDPFTDLALGKQAAAPHEPVRRSMGDTLRFAERMNLAAMTPHNDLASSKYCLAEPGSEYLIYLPSGGRVTVELSKADGSFTAEWFHPGRGETKQGAPVRGGGARALDSPFSQGDAVLYLKANP